MATRTIQASISSGANTDLEPGMSVRFGVTSDTGPVSGMTATGGSLYLSRVKIFSSAFYLTVSPSSGGTAKTETLTANSGDTASTTLDLDSVNDGLLSGSPSSINLTVTKVSGDKTKMNFREGCTLTLKIDYQEGGSSGGDDSGSSGGGGVIAGPYLDKVTGVRLSAEESSGEAVTLSWDAVPDQVQNTVTHYQIARALADENAYLDYGIFVENTGNVTSYEVYPPDEIGDRWYSFFVRAVGSAGEAFNGEWSDECGWLERIRAKADLDPYTDPELTPGETRIKAVHITELQSNINKVRTALDLAAYSFTTITAGYTSLAGWTNHIKELRTAIDATRKSHETWINLGAENRPSTDVMLQLRRVVAEVNNKV